MLFLIKIVTFHLDIEIATIKYFAHTHKHIGIPILNDFKIYLEKLTVWIFIHTFDVYSVQSSQLKRIH